jgi:hypothetical protein
VLRPAAAGALLLAAAPAFAAGTAPEPAAPGASSFTWRTSIKASALLSRAPDAEALPAERDGAAARWRVRLEPEVHLGRKVRAALAYEHRLRLWSGGGDAALPGLDVLARQAVAPYRLKPLDWPLATSERSAWRHELDRANVALALARADVTVGRQAIGWGRGVIFGAVDLFAPFAPLEADREWRRGVDALRADIHLTDRASVDLVGAFGERIEASVLAARLRGYTEKGDLEVVAGRRARDLFAGLTSSAALGPAELHGEVAAFRAPAPSEATGAGRLVVKAVAGGSYRIPVGAGVLVHAEYHYSGFGVKEAARIGPALLDASFRERYLRGDTQILGRHALALLASGEASPELSLSARLLHAPADGSGVLTSSATLTLGDKASVGLSGYLPYGRRPRGATLRSEYGAAPRSLLLELRVYE